MLGGGLTGVYSLVSGEKVIPIADELGPGMGLLSMGTAIAGAGVSRLVSTTRERRQLKREERQAVAEAVEHYQQNVGLYQEHALADAAAAGVEVKGWTTEGS